MNQDRKFERRVADAFLTVSDRNNGEILGHLIDMTIEGFKLRGESAIEVDAVFKLRLDLPPDMTRSSAITFDVVCVWSKKCDDGEAYFSGFQMHFVEDIDLEKIQQIIESPLFRYANKRVHISLSKSKP